MTCNTYLQSNYVLNFNKTMAMIYLMFCCPWKVIKYRGRSSNLSAHMSYWSRFSSSLCLANWVSIILARRTLLISKLPHNVLTPCMHRSRAHSLMKVVFPLPVGPAYTNTHKIFIVYIIFMHIFILCFYIYIK